ncbi:bifunctional glycosyltransferase/CDP-glycerol:glycerophosphate glycerophosphotransferase [Methanosphaera sp.]|uniref:bifunctional glycosyltransferase/CDP-glycerol:glycerophosphate glycerophosphotransferase n=1 Tax=Methanosphaera sp. TaxID=2666342 RepID=UPI002E785EE5|nr:CDP-glycerol glycerophosphotransferase family protein [Methanosphaera sp.]MEE1118203.1 CDP-glycerol glycerophosphotransferase family protein [Methanosphaera sp.]
MDIENNISWKNINFSILIVNDNSDDVTLNLNIIANNNRTFWKNTQIIILGNSENKSIINFQKQYPNNVIILPNENINDGIEKAMGKYCCILKSGDYFFENSLEKYFLLFEKYYDEIDLITFDNSFDNISETRIIDIINEPFLPPTTIIPSIVKTKQAQKLIKNNEINFMKNFVADRLVLEKKKYIVCYDNYTPYEKPCIKLKDFIDIIDYSKDSQGIVPTFIQYDLTKKIQEFLNNNENSAEDFEEKIKSILDHINIDVLLNSSFLSHNLKTYLLYLKNNKKFPLSLKNLNNPEYEQYFKEMENSQEIIINYAEIRNGELLLNGYINTPFNIDEIQITSNVYTNKDFYQIDSLTNNSQKINEDSLTECFFKHDFNISIPFENDITKISLIINLIKDDFYLKLNPTYIFEARDNTDNHIYLDNDLLIVGKDDITFKKFKYSIIIRSIDTLNNLNKSVKSIINQSLNFKENVQLIIPYTENKIEIIKELTELQNEYEDNITLQKNIGKENNEKTLNIIGEYVSFLDCGDTLSENCLEKITEVSENEYSPIIRVPLIIKDTAKNSLINSDFELCDETNGKLNVVKNYSCSQTFLISYFMDSTLFLENYNINFEDKYNDILIINKIISKENTITLINDCFYNKNNLDSKKEESYLDTLIQLKTINKNHYLDSYINNVIINEVNNFINSADSSNENMSEIYKKISNLLNNIDSKYILENQSLNKDIKIFLLYLKNNQEKKYFVNENNTLTLNIGDYYEDISNNQELFIDNIEINEGNIEILAHITSYLDNSFNIELIKYSNNTTQENTSIIDVDNITEDNVDVLGITWKFNKNFKINIPIKENEEFYCYFNVKYNYENSTYDFKPYLTFKNNLIEDTQIIKDNKSISLNKNYLKISKGFNFSIVIAIYNTEDYLNETIDSLISQTLDFEENVQLILVDDGSEDKSLEICNYYQKLYPENIVVLSQKNSGQATARNNGLNYIKGKYVNFLDSDDYLSEETLENVLEFFDKHESEIDVVAIPIKFFGRTENYHILNEKFKSDKIIDLNTDSNNPQLSASSAFFKNNLFPRFKFATDIITSEDSIMINEILLEKNKYGVINSATYYYRKRFDESSTIDNSKLKKEFFIDKLDKYFGKLEDYSIKKNGKVESFIQYLIAYDIQWLLKQPDLSLLNDEEKEEFWKKLIPILRKLDVSVVNNKFITNNQFKDFLLYLITGDKEEKIYGDNAIIKVNGKQVDSLKSHTIWIDIVEIKNGFLNISGFLNSYFSYENLKIIAVKKDLKQNSVEEFVANRVEYPTRKEMKFIDCVWQYSYNFDLKVPISEGDKCSVHILTRYCSDNGNVSKYLKINFHKHARISNISNYIVKDSHILTFKNNTFNIEAYRFKKMKEREEIVQNTLQKSKPEGFKQAKYLRKLALILHFLNVRFFHKQIYLFMDRSNKADDNGEHLFKYAMQQNDGIKKYFILEKDSKDYKRLSKIGKVVGYKSFKHKLLYLLAHKVIGSHPDESLINPFYDDDNKKDVRHLYNGLITVAIYFLQHGVTKDDIAYYLRKYDKNLSLILTVSDEETKSFTDGTYAYDNSIVQTLGFPRYDNLKNDNKKKRILIIPTWRNFLEGNEKLFVNSDYFNALNNLVKDEKFINIAKENGYEIMFKPHPRLEYTIADTDKRYLDLFEFDDYIKISYDETYPELFESGSLLITDYSSVFFDFAYLKKPLIYYHYADDYHHEQSYFDYETMGFGDEIASHEDLINKIEEYIENDCVMEDKYIERVESFFKYTDRNNCKRVYDWIKKN